MYKFAAIVALLASMAIIARSPEDKIIDADNSVYTGMEAELKTLSSQLENNHLTLLQIMHILSSTQIMDRVEREESYLPTEDMADSFPATLSATPGSGMGQKNRVILVNPTAEENEKYEVLKANLDDPHFLTELNLQGFAESEEVKTLPKSLQLILIQKAIDQYNHGYINDEIFLGQTPPIQ